MALSRIPDKLIQLGLMNFLKYMKWRRQLGLQSSPNPQSETFATCTEKSQQLNLISMTTSAWPLFFGNPPWICNATSAAHP